MTALNEYSSLRKMLCHYLSCWLQGSRGSMIGLLVTLVFTEMTE